jgi:hypothetical protein
VEITDGEIVERLAREAERLKIKIELEKIMNEAETLEDAKAKIEALNK